MGFQVKNAKEAYELVVERGSQPINVPTGTIELVLPTIKGIDGLLIYLVDRYENGESIYDVDFELLSEVNRKPVGHGFKVSDHLSHNVYCSRMSYWAEMVKVFSMLL